MDTLAARAAWLASHTGVSLSETDSLAQKTRGHWQAIVTGTVANPTLATLSAYARVCGASVGWLAEGEGEPPTVASIHAAVERAQATSTLRSEADDTSTEIVRPSHPAVA